MNAVAVTGLVIISALFEPFTTFDHIGETDNVAMVRGYYGYYDIHNGKLAQVDAGKPGTLVSTPFDACNPSVDWTTLEWEGEVPSGARVVFAVRGTADNGLKAGFPDESGWTEWMELPANRKSVPIPDALDEKQYLQYKVTLTGGAVLTEVRMNRKLVVPAHPRMLATARDIARARERIKNDPRIKRIFDQFIRHCDNAMIGNPDKLSGGVWHAQSWGQTLGMAYQLTGDRKYADEAKLYLERLMGPITVKGKQIKQLNYTEGAAREFGASEVAREMPAVYDLIYDALTPAERTRYGAKLQEIAQLVEDTTKRYRFSDMCNQVYVKNATYFMAGIALLGDGICDTKAEEWFHRADRELHERLIPASNLWAADDGGWGEGPGYAGFTQNRFNSEVQAWTAATGEDLLSRANFFRYLLHWKLWITRPHDGKTQRFNDSNFYPPSISWPALLASRYRDPRAQYLANRHLEQAMKDSYSYHCADLWRYVLWYDPDLEEEPLTYSDQPMARHFEGVGQVVFRSGWDKDATFGVLKCQSFRSFGHRHADENEFIITKKGALAIDSGVDQRSPREHVRNYFTQTIAHNTVTVRNPDEDTGGYANDGGQYRGQLRKVSGDAPIHTQHGSYYPGSPLMLDGIVAFETNDNYSYACGDATKAYSPDKVKLFLRQMVYLPADRFVIFDRVTSTRPEFTKRWLLHSVNQPRVTGRVFTVSEGQGKLFCQTLLPEDAETKTVGGPGKAFWVDGKNYPPPNPDRAEEAGGWRVEVYPGSPRTEDYFLHLLTVTDKGTDRQPTATLIKDAGLRGVEFQAEGRSYRVTFATEGAPAGHITIRDASGKVLVDRDLTRDIQPQRFMPGQTGPK